MESNYLSGFTVTTGIDLWTGATDLDHEANYLWCSSGKKVEQLNWKSGGQPDSAAGDCVFTSFSSTSVNASTFATANCADKKLFVCEVRQESLCFS